MTWFNNLSRQRKSSIITLAALAVLSISRLIADADDLTSSGTVAASLRVGTPLLLAGLAALWSERAGIVNIGIEGMMIVGTWLGGWGAWHWGSWAGIGLAMVGGILVGLLHAVATVHFNIDHVVSGIAINILAAGTTEYLSIIAFKGQQGGGESQSPPGKGGYGKFDMPLLSGGNIGGWKTPDVLGRIEGWHDVPLLPDLAGLIRGITSDVNLPTVLAMAFIPATAYVLWRTRFGLRLRSSGESPQAGESLGVSVTRVRYQALAVAGAIAAFGGAYLSCVATSTYRQGQVAGKGYIGLATNIFGNWNPTGVFRGAMLFGFPEALRFRAEKNVPTLFLVAFIVVAIVALMMFLRKRLPAGSVSVLIAGISLYAFIVIDEVPQDWVAATPYIVTLVVLAGARQSLRPPAYAGLPYRPGDTH
jgi:simple sugar transport system permease protein